MPDSFFCFCAFLHKSIRLTIPIANLPQVCSNLTIPIANLLQSAATLQSPLQTSCNLWQPCKPLCRPPCKWQQPCKPLCKPPAICGNLANPFADLLQFAATLQTPLQTSFIHKKPLPVNGKRLLKVLRSGLPRRERVLNRIFY